MTTSRWPMRGLIAGLILAICILATMQVSAQFPGQSPPGLRVVPPMQPAPPFIPPRQVDDQRFVRPSQQQQQSQTSGTTSGTSGTGGAAAAGGLSGGGFSGGGFSGFGGSGGGGGFFFGPGRMARMGGNQAQGNQAFYGSFNFGGFKGYGFGGADMSSWRSNERPAMDGGASVNDK